MIGCCNIERNTENRLHAARKKQESISWGWDKVLEGTQVRRQPQV